MQSVIAQGAGMVLRRLSMDDAEAITWFVQDAEITRFTTIPRGQTLEGTREWLSARDDEWESGADMSLGICDAKTGELMGVIGMRISRDDREIGEIGYWLAAPYRGRGLMRKAIGLVCAWGFGDLSLKRIQISTAPDNPASQRTALGAGFSREGVLRGYRRLAGTRCDLVMFSRLPED